jgi:aminoglycoside phosphotransferase (APT) family kinase protein
VRQFRGGQSNPTYLLTAPGRRHALRRKPLAALGIPSAGDDVERHAARGWAFAQAAGAS